VTGTIWMSMLLHALMDAHSGHLVERAYERAELARARVEPSAPAGGPEGAPTDAAARVLPDRGTVEAPRSAAAEASTAPDRPPGPEPA
jgi:hypothetical protein